MAQIPRVSLLQSYDYSIAARRFYGQKPRWGVIQINGENAGLVQMMESGLPVPFTKRYLLHVMMVDNAPLWLPGFGSAIHVSVFFSALNDLYPARAGRWRRVLPNVEDSPVAVKFIEKAGFSRKDAPPHHTIWLDLRPDLEALRAGLLQKWRNILNKAEKSDLRVRCDDKGHDFAAFIMHYKADMVMKDYRGASPKLMALLGAQFLKRGNLLVLTAYKDIRDTNNATDNQTLENDPIAGIIILCHGKSATYQAGWSGDEGRQYGAHNFLLWRAIEILKSKDITDFDLGGINENGAKNIKHFKSGLGGAEITYAGHYV